MIRGVHTMFYTSEPERMRAFLRDSLGLPATDVGEGWLLFDLPEADMGCHPAEEREGGASGTPSISFYCDDIAKTMAELHARGVEFTGPVQNHGYGLVTFFRMPGNFAVQLYQPLYTKPRAQPKKVAPSANGKKTTRPKKKQPRKKSKVRKAKARK